MTTKQSEQTETPIATIPMRMPNGKKSEIRVYAARNDYIDIIFARTSEGEALVRLPRFAAEALAAALTKSGAGE